MSPATFCALLLLTDPAPVPRHPGARIIAQQDLADGDRPTRRAWTLDAAERRRRCPAAEPRITVP